MSKCEFCRKEMLKADGCIKVPFKYKDGTILDPIKFGDDDQCIDEQERCGDCGCKVGSYHHSGCDIEICPRCNGQAISCDCEWKEE